MNVKPGICKGKESILADPVEVQHYLMDSQKDRLEIQPVEASEIIIFNFKVESECVSAKENCNIPEQSQI